MPSKPLKAIKPMFATGASWKIVRGDKVQVMAGKDKGKKGEVLQVIRDQRFPRVFVSGVNLVTRHIRQVANPDGTVIPGYTVKYEAPIHYSNVMLLDPEMDKPVRVYFAYEDKPPYRRVRRTRGKYASNCVVPWPEAWRRDAEDDSKGLQPGEKDTKLEDAQEVTYNPNADFTIKLPSAHKRLRELRELREAAAAAAEAAQQQQKQQQQSQAGGRKLFDTSSATTTSSTSTREYHTTSTAETRDVVQQVQHSLASCSIVCRSHSALGALQQQLQFSSSSSSSISGISHLLSSHRFSSQVQQTSWCGVAAAPLLLC